MNLTAEEKARRPADCPADVWAVIVDEIAQTHRALAGARRATEHLVDVLQAELARREAGRAVHTAEPEAEAGLSS